MMLLVASGGGHLKQLAQLAPRLPDCPEDEQVWVTFDTPQSRSLLAGRRVVFVRNTAPRDAFSVAVNAVAASGLLRKHRIERVVTTGAGIALSFIPPARVLGAQCHYIESAARCDGPSVTGRLLQLVPDVHLYTQHPCWERDRWQYRGSVFEGYEPAPQRRPRRKLRIVVSLGTIPFGFRRLLNRLVDILPWEAEILWQTGETDVSDLDIHAQRTLPALDLERALSRADLFIAHSGAGSALTALEAGVKPILVPRRRIYGEHVDDHQEQIARDLAQRDLAFMREVEELTLDELLAVAGSRVADRADQVPFDLAGGA